MAQPLRVSEHDHIAGSVDAPVILIEYGDFECPHCGRAYPILQSARRQLGDKLALVYRHFPLAEAHPHAVEAAEAAEAAAAQGKFWEMHAMLFEHQDALEEQDLLAYADALVLDIRRFATELTTGVHEPRVRADFRSGVRNGVNGTPTFFINGERFDGDWSDGDDFIGMLAELADEIGPPSADGPGSRPQSEQPDLPSY
jgi:protein-disulfide isomerase